MLIEPPVPSWPPKAFTPSRCALESRPFVELPPPFLCAIALIPSQIFWVPQGLASETWEILPALLAGCGVGHAVGLDGLDANLGKVLPVALQLLVLLLALQVEDQDLVAAAFAENLGGHLGGGRPR